MAHEPLFRLVPGAKTAVVFIHGIHGSPDHFRTVLPLEMLVPAHISAVNLLLYGHGASAAEFSRASMDQWKQQLTRLLMDLHATHSRVLLVGHSMGALLAVQAAMDFPQAVNGLFLLALPLGIRPTPRALWGAVQATRKTPTSNPRILSARQACSLQSGGCVQDYAAFLPRYISLVRESRQVQQRLQRGELRIPTRIFQSQKDELLSLRLLPLLQSLPWASCTVLKNASHFYYPVQIQQELAASFLNFLN